LRWGWSPEGKEIVVEQKVTWLVRKDDGTDLEGSNLHELLVQANPAFWAENPAQPATKPPLTLEQAKAYLAKLNTATA
jgi:hypothetical protein